MSARLFRVKILDITYPQPVIIINRFDSEKIGLTPGSMVTITLGESYATATVMVTSTIVSEGECALPQNLAHQMGVREEDVVGLKPIGIPQSFGALKKRIAGQRLTETEYLAIVRDVVTGAYGEAEIAAFLLSQLYHPLTDEELSHLIKAMVETGVKIRFEETVYDIHSIGGVPGNSKVALISVPIVAASGLLIPKTSSRAITSPAGTADTMEVLARVDLTIDEIVEIARKVRGVLAWGGRLGLAPADDIFINIERRLSIDPEQQMVASILAKKLSMGVSKLVIDIPTGRGAKVENIQEAERLASLFLTQSSLLGISTRVAITYGGQPIGMSIGPALEAREALKTLMERRGSKSLIDKAFYLAGLILEMSGKALQGKGVDVAREVFLSGKAYEKFKKIIEAQGGNPNIKPDDIPTGKYTYTLTSPIGGAVTHIDNTAITLIARACGTPFDKGAGVELHAKVGYRVNEGDPLLTLYSNSEQRLQEAVELLRETNPIVVEGMLLKTLP